MKVSRAFGAGLGLGLTCGAVTGACMVLGLQVRDEETERQTRYKSYDLVKELVLRFETIHGSIVCRDLIGVDLGTRDGRKEAEERKLFTSVCPAFVRDAAQILEDLS